MTTPIEAYANSANEFYRDLLIAADAITLARITAVLRIVVDHPNLGPMYLAAAQTEMERKMKAEGTKL